MNTPIQDLRDVITFPKGFSFNDYFKGEKELLTPLLLQKGYTNITWRTEEGDSFGPLSRICSCYKDGVKYLFVYG